MHQRGSARGKGKRETGAEFRLEKVVCAACPSAGVVAGPAVLAAPDQAMKGLRSSTAWRQRGDWVLALGGIRREARKKEESSTGARTNGDVKLITCESYSVCSPSASYRLRYRLAS